MWHLRCRMLSEKAGSGMAFFRKFSMDFNKAALCGKQVTPRTAKNNCLLCVMKLPNKMHEILAINHKTRRVAIDICLG